MFPLLSGAGSTREWEFLSAGLDAHPDVRRVPLSQNHSADIIFWLLGANGQFPPSRRECPASKLIIVDYFDLPEIAIKMHFDVRGTFDKGYLLYFKRSWAKRAWGFDLSGILTSVTQTPNNDTTYRGIFPISYGVSESTVRAVTEGGAPPPRIHPVVCTLRGCPQCVAKSPAERQWSWQAPIDSRLQVLAWVDEAVHAWPHLRAGNGSIVGEVNSGARGEQHGDNAQNRRYFDTMRAARVVVTANPASWEGDFRLWEALMVLLIDCAINRLEYLQWESDF
jgi:hypothetical protein